MRTQPHLVDLFAPLVVQPGLYQVLSKNVASQQELVVLLQRIEDVVSRRLTTLTVTLGEAPATDAFVGLDGVRETGRGADGTEVHLEASGEVDALIKVLARYRVLALESAPPSLEAAFLAFYEADAPPAGDDDSPSGENDHSQTPPNHPTGV